MKRWLAGAAAVAAVTLVPIGPAPAGAVSYGSIFSDGAMASSPDAALAPGDTHPAFVTRGTDGFIYLAEVGGTFVVGWQGWTSLGAPPVGAVGDPAIVAWAAGRLDVFVRGGDGRLWQTYRPTVGSFFSPWIKPVGDDGILASGPEVSSRGPGQLDVFVVGTDGSVYQRVYNGAWNFGWIGLGKPATVGLSGEVSSASPVGSSRVDLYARGTDQKLWSKSWDGANWGPWRQPAGNDGVLASPPEAVAALGDTTTMVFVRGTDNQVWSNTFTPTSSSGWQRQGDADHTIRDTPSAYHEVLTSPSSLSDSVWIVVRGADDKPYIAQIYRAVS